MCVNEPLPPETSLVFPAKPGLPDNSRRPLDLFVEYLGQPGSVVPRRDIRDNELIVHPNDPTRLTDQNARLFFESAANTLGDAFGSPQPCPVAGPKGLLDVLRDIGAYLVDRACPDVRYGNDWRSALDRAGVDPFGFLTGPVANRVVAGAVEPGVECCTERWSLDTAGSFLSVIVDAIGEGAVDAFAEDLRSRCSLSDCGSASGTFEAVDGKLLVAILGLTRFGHASPHDPESLVSIFGTDSDKLARQLRAWCWLWAGSEGDSERSVPQRVADKLLRDIGWVRKWHGQARDDALLDALRKEPDAFPRRLAISSPEPAVTTLAPRWCTANAADTPAAPAAEEDKPAEEAKASGAVAPTDGVAPEGFRLLRLDEIYRFRPITLVVFGMSGVGKSTFLLAVHHHLMERRFELFPGADELVLSDRSSRTIRDSVRWWITGENTPSTPEAVLEYALELPRLMTIRLVDHRGALVDLRRDSEPDADEQDERLLTEAMKVADGIVALVSAGSLVEEARGDQAAADQRVPDVDAIAERSGRVLSGRQSDHVPVGVVFNKLDEILEGDEFQPTYYQGSVFGDGVSGGHLPRVDAEQLTKWSVRQPIATRSLAAQSMVSRSLEVLEPVCAQLAAHTRRIELFFTSSKPVAAPASHRTGSPAGPAAVVSWMLKDHLVPAFIAQAAKQIEIDRKTVASAAKDHDVARRIAKMVAVDPRAGATLSLLPGVHKVIKKVRDRRLTLLDGILRRYGIELPKDPANDEIFSACDRLSDRIDHTTSEIDGMKNRLDAFTKRFRGG